MEKFALVAHALSNQFTHALLQKLVLFAQFFPKCVQECLIFHLPTYHRNFSQNRCLEHPTL